MEGFTSWGHGYWSRGRKTPNGDQVQYPGRSPGGEVPQKLKNNVKLEYNF